MLHRGIDHAVLKPGSETTDERTVDRVAGSNLGAADPGQLVLDSHLHRIVEIDRRRDFSFGDVALSVQQVAKGEDHSRKVISPALARQQYDEPGNDLAHLSMEDLGEQLLLAMRVDDRTGKEIPQIARITDRGGYHLHVGLDG